MYVKKIAAAFVAILFGLTMAVPAQASTPPLSIVALGDSYAAGVGANDYRQGTEGTCWRSLNSVAEQVARKLTAQGQALNLTNVACSGATIDDLRRPYNGVVQLDALKPGTDLAILEIGGNDVGFGGVVAQCLAPETTCAGPVIQSAESKLPGMALNLFKLLGEIKARSPHVKIILLGYGQPMASGANAPGTPGVDPDPVCAPQYFTPDERQQGGQLSAYLDLTLRMTVEGAKLGGTNVSFVSPYDSSLPWNVRLNARFTGRSLCNTTMAGQFYRGLDAVASPPPPAGFGDAAGQTAILHMNRLGYENLAELVMTKLG